MSRLSFSRAQRRLTLMVSTGRCGTQWLASALEKGYADLAEAVHEPLEARYRPRFFLRRYNDASIVATVPEVDRHLAAIRRTLRRRHYIETGWPSYAAIPYFIEVFGAQLRVVHLVRHPVLVSMSLAAMQPYSRPADEWSELAFLDPMSEGVRHRHYAAAWSDMSEYEKALYRWVEINEYGEELAERYPKTPFLRVRMEDMFDAASPALDELVSFMGLPLRDGMRAESSRPVDVWSFVMQGDADWRQIHNIPEAIPLMERYGYNLDGLSNEAIAQQYGAQSGRRLSAGDRGLSTSPDQPEGRTA